MDLRKGGVPMSIVVINIISVIGGGAQSK